MDTIKDFFVCLIIGVIASILFNLPVGASRDPIIGILVGGIVFIVSFISIVKERRRK